MFRIPITRPISRASKRQSTSVAVALSVCCLVTLLFLIGAAIAVALIPIYLSNREVDGNSITRTSKEITIIAEVEESRTTTGSRRRRATGDLAPYVGGELSDEGKKVLAAKLLASLPSKIVSEVIVPNASLGYKDQGNSKRSLLSKRQSFPVHAVVIVIRFYIIYARDCLFQCQVNSGPVLQSALSHAVPTFVLVDIEIIRLGVSLGRVPRIEIIVIIYISSIISTLNPSTVGTSPVTVTLTTTRITTTTTITTAKTTVTTRGITATTTAPPSTPSIG